jgi:hypothetical protein
VVDKEGMKVKQLTVFAWRSFLVKTVFIFKNNTYKMDILELD